MTAQTAFLDVGAGRAAAPRFYARVGGRCFRRRWPSGSNGTPAVHRRTISDAPCARTRSKRVRGTPKALFRPLGTPRARCGAILGSDIPRGMCPRHRVPVLAAAGIVAQLCACVELRAGEDENFAHRRCKRAARSLIVLFFELLFRSIRLLCNCQVSVHLAFVSPTSLS